MHSKPNDSNYIIIVKILMIESLMQFKIHDRLQEITGKSLPFGGKDILVFDDSVRMKYKYNSDCIILSGRTQKAHKLYASYM